jgi:Mg2+ and Co2+ transporter CorA
MLIDSFDQRLSQVQRCIENLENQAQEQEEEEQLLSNQEMLIDYFRRILVLFQNCVSSLENRANDFSTMPALDQKRQVIAGSNREFSTMQDSLTSMQRVIKMIPLRNREPFEQTVARCRKVITELRARFAPVDEELQRLIRDEEAQAEEMPRMMAG